MNTLPVIEYVTIEIARCDHRWGPFKSSHEGLGVLTEEYHELVTAIRGNRLDKIRAEAIQVAAAALRLAEACGDTGFAARSIK